MLAVAMHPQVIGRAHLIMMLKECIKYVIDVGGHLASLRDIVERIGEQ